VATSLAEGAVRAAPAAAAWKLAAGAVPAALVVAAGLLLSGRVPETAFLALAVLVGLPHGAFDHDVGRRAFAGRHGARWWQPFLAGYLILLAATLLLWLAAPGLALPAFLLLSVLHFGDADAPAETPARPVRVAAHGGAVVVVTAASHPGEVERVFAVLAPADARWIEAAFAGPLLISWAAAAIGTLGIYAGSGRRDDQAAAVDLVLIALLFALVPPLVAFSLYFAVLHAPRALGRLVPSFAGFRSVPFVPVLLTLLAAAFAGLVYVGGGSLSVESNVVRTTFLLLSALTVPHMWLGWRARSAAT